MSFKTLLKNEITEEIGELNRMQVGTPEYTAAVDGLAKLMDKAIDLDKFESESNEKIECREIDTQLRVQQMKDEKKDRIVKNILTGLGIAVPTAAAIWGTIVSLKFEEEGTVTTIMGRGWIGKLILKK